MSITRMSKPEREAFLADLHVGVLCIPSNAGPPLSAPVWYDYEPGGLIWFLTGKTSEKGKLLKVGTKVTLVAQREAVPYAYVSVEGTVTAIRTCDPDQDTRPMARRYLGTAMGDAYARSSAGDDSVRIAVQPDRWRTVDYPKNG